MILWDFKSRLYRKTQFTVMEIKLLVVILATLVQRSCQNYLGCYKDDPAGSDLNEALKVFDTTNSPDICLQYCTERNYLYAGVGLGINCYCGNRFGSQGIVHGSECNLPCPGNNAEITCGGDMAAQINSTGINPSDIAESRMCKTPECKLKCKKLGRTHGYCVEITDECKCSLDSTVHGCPEHEEWCNYHCQGHGRKLGQCFSSVCYCAVKIMPDGVSYIQD